MQRGRQTASPLLVSISEGEGETIIQTWSYHTHNRYCDGKGEIEEVVQEALACDLQRLGISSHAPLPFAPQWTMDTDQLDAYIDDVHALQDHYRARIQILLGAEIDFIPDPRVATFQNEVLLRRPFQYFVGSVHFLGHGYPPRQFNAREDTFHAILREEYDGNIRDMVEDYYARVRSVLEIQNVRIVGHLDLIKRWNGADAYFHDDAPWYRAAVEDTLAAIAARGQAVELNTSGWLKGQDEPYPAMWILKCCKAHGIPVLVSSDSHEPMHVARDFSRAQTCLSDLDMEVVDPLADNEAADQKPGIKRGR